MAIEVDVVRVFTTDDGSLGNELGVVIADAATLGHELEIAAELGFSETVLISEVTDGSATVRIFTPAIEMPFAGHPTVGTAWWLASQGTTVDALEVRAGRVSVRNDGDVTWVTAAGSWAPEFVWHPLGSPAEVEALEPSEFASGQHYAYAWIDEDAGALRSRMFAPAFGIDEDQATGAAAVRLTWELGHDLDINQGIGSRLRTRVLPDGFVELGGRTVFDRRMTL